MGLRLSVQRGAWQHHVEAVATDVPGMIPVVKGNGYGFGRHVLMPIAAALTTVTTPIAVGTVYEAADVPTDRTALVLTPHVDRLPDALPTSAILTVGGVAHVRALERNGWTGSVVAKLASSMRRYGADPSELPSLLSAIATSGLTLVGHGIHLPLAGDDAGRRGEIEAWLPHLDPHRPLAVSHLAHDAFARLVADHPGRTFQIRVGTALWHGDKALVHLTADVLDIRPVRAGDVAGYRAIAVPGDGHVILVAAGSAHGVGPLDDDRSPFHFDHRRLDLIEPPHMHTSMVFVPFGNVTPDVGARIDVQRPLITTTVDELRWIDD